MASELTPNVSLREAAFLQPPNLATFILGQVMVAARHRRISFYKILAIAWPARKEERSSRCRFRWCTSEWHGGTFAIAIVGILAAASALPFVGAIPATLASLTSGLFQIGIFAAIFVGFVLPYLPAVIWLIAVLAFMLLVIEAVFAAPLWAVAMLSMDGHGISSNIARKGWSLLLMLFLTPLLMVFGFLLGMVLFRIGAFSLNGMLFAALSSQMAADPGAFGGLSSFLIMTVLTVFVAVLYAGESGDFFTQQSPVLGSPHPMPPYVA